MEEKDKEYSGIWKNVGCILSTLAILGIIATIVILIYQFLRGA